VEQTEEQMSSEETAGHSSGEDVVKVIEVEETTNGQVLHVLFQRWKRNEAVKTGPTSCNYNIRRRQDRYGA
jgi:hypothetical protein